MNEEPKFTVEQVDAVAPPPRARVDDAEAPADKLERKRDYLEGFLKEQPSGLAGHEPGGDLYEGVIAALKDIFDPEIPVNIYDLGLIYGVDITPDGGAPVTLRPGDAFVVEPTFSGTWTVEKPVRKHFCIKLK